MTGSEDTPPARRGRPPGEVTPEALIKAELIAHLRLYKRMREMVEAQLAVPGRLLDVDETAKYMDLLRKGIVDMSKPFIAAAKPTDTRVEEAEDGEAILRGMIEGLRR